jgi:hypothetical protein
LSTLANEQNSSNFNYSFSVYGCCVQIVGERTDSKLIRAVILERNLETGEEQLIHYKEGDPLFDSIIPGL